MKGRISGYILKVIRVIIISNLILIIASFNLYSQNLTSKIDKPKKNKIAPNIQIDRKSSRKINIRVQVNDSISFKNWLEKNDPGLNYKKLNYSNIYEIKEINTDQIKQLVDSDFVDFVDVSHRTVVEDRLMDDSDLAANKVESVHALYPDLSGQGLTVSVKENLFDTRDIDFKGRIKNIENGSDILSLHATMMSTLIAGAGNNGPKGKGVAWKAEITSSDFVDLFPDDVSILSDDDISVQNHSYGVDFIENYYGLESQQYDIQCTDFPEMLHVFSSGNMGTSTSDNGVYSGIEGYANLTGQFKTSKNTISVGEMDSYGNVKELSSRGPAFDGRVKPELVAFGYKGSSESAALVSGISLLVQNAYKEQDNENLPPASLIKSILINSADDVGRAEVDFESGYGSVDALGAIKTVIENRFIMDTIAESETKSYSITVPENTFKLKITIVWNDPSADAGIEKALVNDLDLELHEVSSGNSWEPWVLSHYPHIDSITKPAIRTKDHINNVEQITLNEPNAGEYELQVFGTSVQTEQAFSIAYEYESGFQWIYPLKENSLLADKNIQIRWQWNMNSEIGDVEYKIIEDDSWEVINESVDLSNNYIDWQLPDTTKFIQLRIKTLDQELLSDTILISKTPDLSVGMDCEDETLIFWNPITSADSYDVYKLGDQFLELFTSTVDTFFILEGDERNFLYYSVSPVINNVEGFKSRTINYSTQNVDCYFVSFIPKEFITDTVILKLELASNYRLTAVNLERYDNGSYETIQRIDPVVSIYFELLDENPNPNRNTYRVRLERDDLTEVFSHEEVVFFNPVGSLLVYPNPVHSYEELNIIDGEDGASTVRIFDSSGRVCYVGETYIGMLKVIQMNQFNPGLYFVEIESELGYKKVLKIIVL